MAPTPHEPTPPSAWLWLDSFASTMGPYLGWPYPSWTLAIAAWRESSAHDRATDAGRRRRRHDR